MLTQNKIQTMNGAKLVINTLKDLGVDTIFGYPGGVVLELYDELYKQKDIKHILVRHEQSATHAAEGYARTTGKCGVVLVTSGPGATNTITGITNAYLDGYPLIVIAGQVFKNLIGKDAFQEANICEMTKTCTKKVFQISDIKNLQSTFFEAFKIANSGKKGPVVIDITKDVFSQNAEYNANINVKETVIGIDNISVSRIADLINNSKKPVIITGGGVNHSQACEELQYFINSTNIPVVSTMMGLGAYNQQDEHYLGMIGIFGNNSANSLLKKSDLIISLGARFNDRISCMFDAEDLSSKLIQIDINEKEISRVIKPIESIICDIKDILPILMTSVNADFSDWLRQAQDFRILNKTPVKSSNMVHSFEIIRTLDKITQNKDVIFTSEVGQHQLWAIRDLHLNPDRKILLSGGAGTMGFGLPAAIGAAIANPKRPVVCITGDGSFQMSLHELATCKDYNLNIKILILNNGYLGMVRQLQQNKCEGRYSQTKISNPDFVTLAQSYGIKSSEVHSSTDIENALNKAFSTDETYIIDFKTEPFETL